MSSSATFDAKEQVRQATDIVELAGSYMQLRRQGSNYVGLCPWHDDSKPSLQFNAERQTFKCWVCDLGGDVFSFLMKIDGLEFREALETLAERANISLAPTGAKPKPGGPGDKKTLLAAAAWAEEQFHRCLLNDPQAKPAMDYLVERGISADSINRFHIGFAPESWDWLLNKSRSTTFSPQVLDRIGLVKQRQKGEGWYDFYRGRVMFPIRDVRSRPIAFGGRVLPQFAENAGGKYINSPETPLFSKSNQLYALDLARDAIASEEQIIVTEGYTDVIMAHQHGVENVVAVLGTALGEKHLPLIRRFTDSIALVLDGDEAGQRRTNEVLELFVANQIDLKILGLPEGLDPCDFIATPDEEGLSHRAKGGTHGRGPNAFRELVRQAPDALEHKMRTVTNGLVTADDTHGISNAVEQLLATLAKAGGGVGTTTSEFMLREQSLLGRLARRFQLPEEGLRTRLASLRRGASSETRSAITSPNQQPQPATHCLNRIPAREAELLELLLVDLESARKIFENVPASALTSSSAQTVYQLVADQIEEYGEVDFHRLLDAVDDSLSSLLVHIDDARQAKSESDKLQRLNDVLNAYQREQEEAERRTRLASLRDGSLDRHQEEEVLNQFFTKLKSRQTGTLPTEG